MKQVHHSRIRERLQADMGDVKAIETNTPKPMEHYFRWAVEAAANAIVIVNAQGEIVMVNAQAESYFGYQWEELIGQTIERLVPERFRDLHKNHRAEFFNQPQSRQMGTERNLVGLRKDGSEFPIEIGLTPITTEGETLFLATIIDITQRKQAEEALSISQERYHSLFTNMLDGFAYCKMEFEDDRPQDFVYLDVNPAFEILTGLKDVVGRKVTAVIPGIKESNPELFEIYGKVALTGKPESFETYVEPLGIWLHISVYSPERGYFAAVFENITSRKQADEALRESEERFRQLSEASFEGIAIHENGRILEANRAFIAISGYEPWEIIGKPVLDMAAPESRPMIQHNILTGFEEPYEAVGLKKDGSRFDVELRGKPISWQGRIARVTIVRDITERKKAEKNLWRQVDEMTALYESTHDLVIEQDLSKLLQLIVARAVKLLQASSGGLYLCETEQRQVRCVVSYNTPRDFTGTVLKYGEGAAGMVAETGEPLIIDDYRIWAKRAAAYEQDQPFISVMSVPMRWQDRVIGVIHILENSKPCAFNDQDLRTATLFANQAAIAVENNRLFEEEKRQQQEAAAITEVSRDISAALQLDVVLERIAFYAKDLLNAESSAVYLTEPATPTLRAFAATGPDAEEIKHSPLSLGTGILGNIAVQQLGDIVNNANADPRAILVQGTEMIPHEHLMGVPVISKNQLIGLIAVWRIGAGQEFKPTELDFLSSLAGQVAIAIENARLFGDVRKRAQEQAALYETTREFAAQSNLEKLLNTVTERAVDLLGADRAAIYLFNVENNELEVVADTKKGYIGIRLKMGEGMAGRVAQSRQPMMVDDYQTWEHRAKAYEGEHIGAVLEVPMLYQGELLGVLFVNQVHNRNNPQQKDLHFTQADAHLLELFASAAAGAVYSARLFEKTHQRAQEQTALYDTTRDLAAQSDLKALLNTIAERAVTLLNGSRGAIYQLDAEKNELKLVADTKGEYFDIPLKMGEGAAGRVAQSRQPLIVDDYQNWEYRVKAFEGGNIGSLVEVPMLYQGKLLGVLLVDHSLTKDGSAQKPRRFTQDDAHLLELFASSAAGAVYSAMLLEQTRRHARQMENINALGRALTQSVDLNAINERLAQASLDLMPESDTVFIYQYDSESRLFSTMYGLQGGKVVDVSRVPPIPIASTKKDPLGKVATTGKPLILDNLQTASNKRKNSKAVRVDTPEPMTQSALYVPMAAEGKVIGILQVQSPINGRYASTDAELLSLVANNAAVASQNALLFTKLQQRVDQLSGLHAIDTAIGSTTDLRMSLRTVLDNVIHLLGVDSAAILLMNPTTLMLEHFVSRGFRTADITQTSIRFGDGPAGQAAFDRKLIHLPNPAALAQQLVDKPLFKHEGFQAYVVAPLVAKGQVRGVLEVYKRSPLPVNQEWQNFLKVMANQASLAVDSGQMFEGLGRANLELTLAYDATIEGWSQALDLRDKETEGHTRRVTNLTLRLARLMEITPASTIHIRRGALLHDIGKMGIPDRILFKPGKLTEEEWKIMRCHPEYAYDLLSGISYLRPALEIPYSHHEKWDGSGYPAGLKDENIPLSARIFAIVDVYDALISDRPYRHAWSKKQAITYIREQSGKHFDPKITKVFLDFIKEIQKHP